MAARYLSEIRTVQPTGPYHIGGFSMGGLVAYEMAQQLRAAGEEVALLALLDTFPKQGPRRSTLAFWFAQQDNALRDRRPLPIARYLARGALNIELNARIALFRRCFGLAWRFSERFLPAMPMGLRRPVAASLLASRSYRVRPYDGDAVLFTAEDHMNDHDHVVENWRKLVRGRLEVLPVSGTHRQILDEPYVGTLARQLSERLRKRAGKTAEAADLAAAD
jgi:acetoacetyl-CoA synthetase